jgi:hypothetical protein
MGLPLTGGLPFQSQQRPRGSEDNGYFTYQWPSQKDLGSFISNQRPENSTPSVVQLRRASFHHSCTLGASQSGNAW